MLVVVLALIAVQCDGFMTPRGASILPVEKKLSSPPKTTMNLSDADLPAAANDARRLFSLWFFGGSGGGGIAIAAFPQMYSRFMGTRGLKGQGPTLGGDKLGISPLCGLPEDLSVADVEKILRNKKSVETMVEKGPKDSFWAEKGYLRFEAFQAANPKCNPLALRAIFDALTTSTSTVEPDVAQELLDEFREDTATFKKTLLLTKAKGYSAIAFLLFLLGLTATVSAESLAAGWFPDWPGNNNFPIGLVNPGIWTIPDYWI
jgi:hypothetical protein